MIASGCQLAEPNVPWELYRCMSTRGTNFLDQWIRSNVPKTVGADVISVAELTQKLFADAKTVGISSTEIEEDTGSV